jgi:hypothetical protein
MRPTNGPGAGHRKDRGRRQRQGCERGSIPAAVYLITYEPANRFQIPVASVPVFNSEPNWSRSARESRREGLANVCPAPHPAR